MLNLQKNDVFVLDLKKRDIENLNIGLGWDTRADLDVHAILRDRNGKQIEEVYFGRKSTAGVKLSGDNLTGEGDGDDEIIFINRNSLPNRVCYISIYVNIYSGVENFGKVAGGYIRLFDESTGKVLAKSELDIRTISKGRAVHFVDIDTTGDEYRFRVVMDGGRTLTLLKDRYELIKDNFTNNVITDNSINARLSEEPKAKKRGFFGSILNKFK